MYFIVRENAPFSKLFFFHYFTNKDRYLIYHLCVSAPCNVYLTVSIIEDFFFYEA